jgi:hypothetical protein
MPEVKGEIIEIAEKCFLFLWDRIQNEFNHSIPDINNFMVH